MIVRTLISVMYVHIYIDYYILCTYCMLCVYVYRFYGIHSIMALYLCFIEGAINLTTQQNSKY